MSKHLNLKDKLSVREAQVNDLAAVAEIYNTFICAGNATMDTEIKTAEYYQQWQEQASDREVLWVLEEASQIVGWAIIKAYSDRIGYAVACETAVYLQPICTGKGYGSYIKKKLMKQCQDFGYHHLVAKIFADNAASIEYNKRLGYDVVGTQREIGLINGERKDITILQYIFDK